MDRWMKITYEEWHDQIRVTKRQAMYAKKSLESQGLISSKVKKFNNIPCGHYKVDFETLTQKLIELDEDSGKLQNVTLESNKMSLPMESNKKELSYITENKENTSESGESSSILPAHTSVINLKKQQAEKKALENEEAKALFDAKFTGRNITIEKLFEDCQEHYEQSNRWATRQNFIKWIKKENQDLYPQIDSFQHKELKKQTLFTQEELESLGEYKHWLNHKSKHIAFEMWVPNQQKRERMLELYAREQAYIQAHKEKLHA